jgi:hypothetical protein
VDIKMFVNHKNFSEVLAACGLVILAECLDSPIIRCRFTPTKTMICDDNVFRSMLFEFEHPGYDNLQRRIAALDVSRVDGNVTLREHGSEIINLDWFELGGFIGDKGNFSKLDKLQFVKLHHSVFAELATSNEDLFSLSAETAETNYLANLSQLKKNYIDAGGVYDSSSTSVFARDFLLIVALQNFRSMMSQLITEGSFLYGLATEWTLPAGLFAALVGGGARKKYEARIKRFGKDGLVLAVAREMADEMMIV